MKRIFRIAIVAIFAALQTGNAWAFDPESADYDPELKFVVTPFGDAEKDKLFQ